MLSRRLGTAVLFAAALAAVFATHVFTSFHPIRVIVVRSPLAAANGQVRTVIRDSHDAAELQAPVAVIWRIRNSGATSAALSLTVDGRSVCARRVAPASSSRVDCAMSDGWTSGRADHEIAVSGPATQWTLEYFELATHHGGSAGSRGVVILPAGSTHFARTRAPLIAAIWVLLTLVLLVPPATSSTGRALVIAHRVAAWAIVGALTLALLTPIVTSYNIIVSATTFVVWMGLIFARRLVTLGRWVAERTAWSPTGSRLGASLCAALVVLIGFGVLMRQELTDRYQGNYSGFLHISRERLEHNPILDHRADVAGQLRLEDGSGYDGQFMYFMAFDPFLRAMQPAVSRYREVVDAPPYRFGRIGFSLLTKGLSFDRWPWYPAVMVWMVLVATGGCALALALIAQSQGASPFWGLLTLLVPGFWQSIQVGLPEPLAAAFLLGGAYCLLEERWVAAGFLLALSLLVRETSAVFVICFAIGAFTSGHRRGAALAAAIAVLPFVVWRLYVGGVLFSDFGLQAFFFGSHNLALPFRGFADLWRALAQGAYHPEDGSLARAAVMYPALLIFGIGLALVGAVRRPSPAAIAAVLYGAIAVSLDYTKVWSHVGDGQRVTCELFVALALIAPTIGRARWERWLRNAFWLAGGVYVFYGAFDAPVIRNAVLSLVW